MQPHNRGIIEHLLIRLSLLEFLSKYRRPKNCHHGFLKIFCDSLTSLSHNGDISNYWSQSRACTRKQYWGIHYLLEELLQNQEVSICEFHRLRDTLLHNYISNIYDCFLSHIFLVHFHFHIFLSLQNKQSPLKATETQSGTELGESRAIICSSQSNFLCLHSLGLVL